MTISGLIRVTALFNSFIAPGVIIINITRSTTTSGYFITHHTTEYYVGTVRRYWETYMPLNFSTEVS